MVVGLSQEIVVPVVILANVGEKCGEKVPMVIRNPDGVAVVEEMASNRIETTKFNFSFDRILWRLVIDYLLIGLPASMEWFIVDRLLPK